MLECSTLAVATHFVTFRAFSKANFGTKPEQTHWSLDEVMVVTPVF